MVEMKDVLRSQKKKEILLIGFDDLMKWANDWLQRLKVKTGAPSYIHNA